MSTCVLAYDTLSGRCVVVLSPVGCTVGDDSEIAWACRLSGSKRKKVKANQVRGFRLELN